MQLHIGFIVKQKNINFHTQKIYQFLDACAIETREDHQFFCHSGKYNGTIIQSIEQKTSDNDIYCCSLPDNMIKEFMEDLHITSFQNVIDEIRNLYHNNYFVYKDNLRLIEDEKMIMKCKVAFKEEEKEEKKIDASFSSFQIEEKYKKLKEYIFGQDEQLKIFLSCFIRNQNLIGLGFDDEMIAGLKSNILLIGTTGVGKTYMIKQITKLFDVPLVIEDATRYTSSGFTGEDVDNMIRNLYVKSGKNKDLAELGVIYIDEFDKLCKPDEGSNIATIAVQQELLKLVEGTTLFISTNNHSNVGGFTFDTRKVTFILGGAFDGIKDIIDKRCKKKTLGFQTEKEEIVQDTTIQKEDLKEYGMILELIGRMTNFITLKEPEKEDLKNAFLYSKASSLNLSKAYFEANGITVEFDDAFVDAVAVKSLSLKTGYRGLNQTLNAIVEKEQFNIMSGKTKVLKLTKQKIKPPTSE